MATQTLDNTTAIDLTRINRSDLARKVGCNPTHIVRIFNGERQPSLNLAHDIAERLNISLDTLYVSLKKNA
jgi:DNA-binding XRE family transcriptional regulator